jgi:GNAT superfamily N-acetyltransferase
MNAPQPAAAPAIRRAVTADLPIVLGLLRLLSPDEAHASDERMQEVWRRIESNPRMRVWLLEEAGEALGTYTMLVMDNLGHNGTPLAVVESVVVAPQARGRRLGELMMRHAVERAGEAGCYKLALSSNNRRLDAHRFYRRLGFVPHGISFAISP